MKPETERALNEQWFFRRLRELGCEGLDDGITTLEQRRENARREIIAKGLTAAVISRGPDGKPMLCPEAFERLYGVPFESEVAA